MSTWRDTENKRIVLNWMSPGSCYRPSPAMSVLKAYLSKHQYTVDIEYWNLRFMQMHSDFMWGLMDTNGHTLGLLLYLNYLAIYKKDQIAYARVKVELKALQPKLINLSDSYFDEHMELYAQKVDVLFDEIVNRYDFENTLYMGFEANLYQWVASSILAEKIKRISPSTITVIGGIGTRDTAKAFLINFSQFDIAMWGEGELPLLHLSNIIRDNQLDKIDQVCNIAYRDTDSILTSTILSRAFDDLSSTTTPDYADFFQLAEEYQIPKYSLSIVIEGSRGCHWKRCHFCYLNNGYKFRYKAIRSLCEELESAINKFSVFNIMFLDNDLIVNDYTRFNQLLDEIIKLKDQHPKLRIDSAEIITKGITASVVKKMAIAGFQFVQIGYESPSDNLLKKIDKKNTFASNLSFIKFAQKYNITILGANIIQSLLEETNEDIIEAIDNLHYLRFYYKDKFFEHSISQLAITKSSPYYHKAKSKMELFQVDSIATFLPQDYIKDETKISIFEYSSINFNYLWSKFMLVENNYKNHQYTYILYQLDDAVFYKEYYDSTLINCLEFEIGSLDILILEYANNGVVSVNQLLDRCQNTHNVTIGDIIECINILANERLLFHNADYSENIAVIDIESLR